MLMNAKCSLFFVNLCLDINANVILVQGITFVNSAGPEGGQAVALRTAGNNIAIYQCSIQGYQDTLFTAYGQQFFRECEIYGTIDFIFGDAAVVFQKLYDLFEETNPWPRKCNNNPRPCRTRKDWNSAI